MGADDHIDSEEAGLQRANNQTKIKAGEQELVRISN